MITSVKIQNYKSLKNVETDLERLTVFVGANGSGKTSVLSAIHLAVLASENPSKAFTGDNDLDCLYSQGATDPIKIECTTTKGQVCYSFSKTEAVRSDKQKWNIQADAPCKGGPSVPFKGDKWAMAHLSSHVLAKPSYAEKSPPELAFDGSGLASVLAYMALNSPDEFEELLITLRTIIPRLRRIRFAKAPVRRDEHESIQIGDDWIERLKTRTFQGEALLFDFENLTGVSASHVSEGTLLVLGILAVIMGPGRPDILLLDDLEHGLHPLAQKQIILVLRRLMELFPNLQIIATAHSPYLLDELRPEEIRLMAAGEDGYSVCGKLTGHPLFEQWKDEMAPGELWSMFGEKWLLEQGVAK